MRRINWPATAHRGAPHVNQLAAERATEILAVIDAPATASAAGPGEASCPDQRGAREPRIAGRRRCRAVMPGVVAGFAPAAWPAAVAGAAALIAALPGRWPAAGTATAVAAVVTSGIGIAAAVTPLPVSLPRRQPVSGLTVARPGGVAAAGAALLAAAV